MKNMHFLKIFLFIIITNTQLYNHQSNSYRNQSWMGSLDNGIPLRKLSILGTHSSMSQGSWGDAFQTQSLNLNTQLISGIRALDIRCRHYKDEFPIHERLIYLNVDLAGVLNIVKNFLNTHPTQVILMHIVEEYTPSGNTRTFEDTYISYRDQFSSLIWLPTTQNPTLGITRGKVVIIQDFVGKSIHGLLYSTFTSLPHKKYSTNWDQYDKWTAVKTFLANTNTAGESRISFWTGSVGSFPYFVASGKSSPGNNDPRLATGLTTPGFKSYYPDFPRVFCLGSLCTIAFEGINILGYNYYTNNNFQYLGIVFTDFFGDTLLTSFITKNSQLFGKCTTPQTLLGCSVCSTAGICLACDQVLHYIYNTVTKSCLAAPGYYLNSSSVPVLCNTSLIGCQECSSSSICTVCDSISHYILDNSSFCIAQSGYYLNSSSIPVPCTITGCSQCSSISVCTLCSAANNYILDGTSCICNSTGYFVEASTTPACICQPGRYLSSAGLCQQIPLCPNNGSGCSICQNSTCIQCDNSSFFQLVTPYCQCVKGYYYDGLNCILCNITLTACDQCSSSSLCLSCLTNFTLVGGVCQCLPQYYQMGSSCFSCQIGCLSCSSSTNCTLCNAANLFTLVNGICQCQTGLFLSGEVCEPCTSLTGCLTCIITGCTQCDAIFGFNLINGACSCSSGSYVNIMKICQVCPQQGCIQCISDTQCTKCDTSIYYLDNYICKDICGDGILVSLECDDGNIINGDGCSSTCTIEPNFNCSGGSMSNPSACSFSGSLSLSILEFSKNQLKNQFMVKLKLTPHIAVLNNLVFQDIMATSFPYESASISYDSTTGIIDIVYTYNSSLNSQNLQITFNPPKTPAFLYTPSVTATLPSRTDNNYALLYYQPNIYQIQSPLKIINLIILAISLLLFGFGFIFASKLIAVQFIAVIQISFIGLMMIDKLEALMIPMGALWPVNGYNQIISGTNSTLPRRISTINYKIEFIANFNINLILIISPIIIGLALLIYSKIKKAIQSKSYSQVNESGLSISNDKQINDTTRAIKQQGWYKCQKFSYLMMKQYQLSILLFVSYHAIISFGIVVLYDFNQILGIILGILVILGLVLMCLLFFFRPLNFGEYKYFFHLTRISQNFYIIIIILRLTLGFSIIIPNQSSICVYLALSCCLIQFILIIAIRPYISNIRPIFNSLIMIIIITIYAIYRLKAISQAETITTYLPLIVIISIIVCVIVNLCFMIMYVVNGCKSKNIKEKVDNQQKDRTRLMLEQIREKILLENSNLIMLTPNKDNITYPNLEILKQLKLESPQRVKLTQEEVNLYDQI